MNDNTTEELNEKPSSRQSNIDWQKLAWKIWLSRKLVLKICCIGVVIGTIIVFSTPKEYTASTLVAPEGYRRGPSSGISALADMTNFDIRSTTSGERDAVYPSLYPLIVNSTPFLVPLFDIPVSVRKGGIPIPLSQYLKEHQKIPWWSVITSAPFRLVSWAMSLFKEKPKEEKIKDKTNIFHLTREEAGLAGAIASRINIGVDKKRKTITISVTMQAPVVAAAVADTVCSRLKEYITEYRTAKARRNLEYTKSLCRQAQAEYYKAQEKYVRHADANQALVRLASRAEQGRLQNEMDLALATYNQTERQMQAAQARVKRETPVYAIIRPVQVPLTPSSPHAMRIIFVCLFLSGAGCMGWICFGKDFLKSLK